MKPEDIAKKVMPIAKALQTYHRHEVHGLEHVPTQGPAIIVSTHSLATYDLVLLMAAIYQEHGILPRSLIDKAFYKVPYLSDFMELFGSAAGTQENAEALLSDGAIVTLAPGGMREALKPSSQRYQIRWHRRKGFTKLAMKTGAPIILAACPKADDLFDVFPSRITAWVYRTYRLPVFFARGLGPTPLPRPVKLVHLLSEPIEPPPWPDDAPEQEEALNQFHKEVVATMRKMISSVIQDHSK